jgi:PAS domain S-box-containing protein
VSESNNPNGIPQPEERLRFEALLADILARFVNAPPDRVNSEILDAQRRVCECLGLDLSALWEWPVDNPGTFLMIQLYRPLGGPPLPERMDASEHFPWCLRKVTAREVIAISSMENAPVEAARDVQTWRHLGIKTTLTIPLSVGNDPPFGAISFNDMTAERTWSEALIHRLKLVAQIFANAIDRRQAEKALRQSELKYRRLHETMRDAFVSVDMTGRLQECNLVYQQMLGYSAAELSELTYIQLTPERWHAMEVRIVREQVLERGYSDVYEKEYCRKDGTVFPVELRTSLVSDESGQPIGMWAIVRDITQRKQAEQALQLRNQYIETIMEEAPLGFAVHTVDDGAARFVSARFEEIYGVPRGTIDSHYTFFDKVWPYDPDLREQIRSRVVADMVSGDASRMRWENVPVPTANGEVRYITAMNIPVLEQNLMVSTVQDVTEQVRAQEALRESEKRYRLLANNSKDLIWILDWNGRFTYASPSTEKLLGFSVEDFLKRSIDEVLTPESVAAWREGLAQLTDHPQDYQPLRYELEQVRKDGSTVWTEASLSLFQDAAGIVRGVLAESRDITERRQMARVAEQLREDITHLTRVTTMGELTAALAHELNQPLTAIMNNANAAHQMIASGLKDVEEIREILTDIIADDQRAGDIIRRVRNLVKKGELLLQSLDVNEVIGEVARLVHSDALINGIEIRLKLSPELPPVRSDRIQLQQVLLNLIVNAFSAMKAVPGERVLSVQTMLLPADGMLVTVQDSGPGISPDMMETIFTPFFSSKPGGLGMGLAICRTIIASLGGRIWAENEGNYGAVFKFTLPIAGGSKS